VGQHACRNGKKIPSKEANDALITTMMGISINTPSPPGVKSQLSKEAADECVAAVNAAIVILHPTADDQPKCIICTKAVASMHMATPSTVVEGKRYVLNYCTPCMLEAEERGVEFIVDPASCGCAASRFIRLLDCELCNREDW
jgi:hypothetical protein